jgi:hypothetical protein
MAIGDITEITPGLYTFELLASATATSAAPSGATAGLDLDLVKSKVGCIPERVRVALTSTAGSATMTVTTRLWGYFGTAIGWSPMGTGTDANKGVLNAAAATAEVDTDSIKHSEEFTGLGNASRLYLQVTAIGGTSTAVTGYLIAGSRERVLA